MDLCLDNTIMEYFRPGISVSEVLLICLHFPFWALLFNCRSIFN